jgi:hypothetical protein
MSPEQTLTQSLRDYPPPSRKESPIQLIQGWYYVVVGLWVALAIETLQSPTIPVLNLSHLWIVRVFGASLALVGIGLIYASKRKESIPSAVGGPMIVAVMVGLAEIVALANGVLPTTFLMDSFMELWFVVWWMVALYSLLWRKPDSLDAAANGEMTDRIEFL